MNEELRTQRLVLRRATWADVEPMHRLLSDATAMRFWSSLPHEKLEETETWMGSMIAAGTDESDDFIVTLEGAVIGKLGCWRLPEVGFLFDPVVWGRGYATEAMQAFIGRRRKEGSPELTADVDPRNLRSIRLLERCGFVETHRAERTFNIGGEWVDSVYLTLKL